MHWPTKKLGEICKIRTGKKDVDEGNPEGPYPFFTCSREITYSDTYSFDTEAILIAGNGDVGNTKIYKGKFEAYQRTYVLDGFQDNIKYIYYYLIGNLKKILKKLGSTMPYIRKGDLETFEIPLPPLPIQQKIVKILDTIQSAIDIQEKIIEKTKELKKSLMNLLFHYGVAGLRVKELISSQVGKLKSSELEKFGLKLKKTEIGEIPEHWEVVRLGEVVNDLTNGFPAGERDEMGILQLRMDSITSDGKINLNAGVKIPKKKGWEIYLLQKGDILFNNTNSIDLVGKTALYKGEFKECIFSNHITRIRVNPHKTLPEWIFYILFRYWELKLFKNLAVRRVGQADISRTTLKNIKIPFPPLSEQQEIAEILQTIDQKIDIEKRKKELYEELFKTLLNKIMSQEIDVEKIEV